MIFLLARVFVRGSRAGLAGQALIGLAAQNQRFPRGCRDGCGARRKVRVLFLLLAVSYSSQRLNAKHLIQRTGRGLLSHSLPKHGWSLIMFWRIRGNR